MTLSPQHVIIHKMCLLLTAFRLRRNLSRYTGHPHRSKQLSLKLRHPTKARMQATKVQEDTPSRILHPETFPPWSSAKVVPPVYPHLPGKEYLHGNNLRPSCCDRLVKASVDMGIGASSGKLDKRNSRNRCQCE